MKTPLLLLGLVWALDASAQETRVRILTTHDLHGAITPRTYSWSEGRPLGGVATLKTLMDRAAEECACTTFRLDGGDQMQGTLESNLTFGASVVEAFNLLELDAAAIGNHELDWGVDTLRVRLAEAEYPWLATNVFVRATGERADWAQPWALVERDGVTLGVVGWATETSGRMLMTSVSGPYLFSGGISHLRASIDTVRARGADLVAVVAHATGDCERGCGGEMVRLATRLDSGAVDLIVGGHRHTPGYGVVNGIPILRAGSSGSAVGVVDIYSGREGERRVLVRVDTAFADVIPPDETMLAAMAPHLARADSLAQKPVAVLAAPMQRRGREYGLGRLVADAVRRHARADVSLTNRGGIRADLPGGTVTYGDLFTVKPFGNTIEVFELTGAQLLEVIEHAVRGAPEFFSGIVVTMDVNGAQGQRVRGVRLHDGRTVTPDGRYTFATSNFLGGGGGGYDMLESLERRRTGVTVLDALVELLKNLPSPVVAPEDERVNVLGR